MRVEGAAVRGGVAAVEQSAVAEGLAEGLRELRGAVWSGNVGLQHNEHTHCVFWTWFADAEGEADKVLLGCVRVMSGWAVIVALRRFLLLLRHDERDEGE